MGKKEFIPPIDSLQGGKCENKKESTVSGKNSPPLIKKDVSEVKEENPLPEITAKFGREHRKKATETDLNTAKKREHEPMNKKKEKKQGKKRRWLRILLIITVILFLSGTVFVAGLFLYFMKDLPSPEKINKRTVAESSKIYARDGQKLLYEVHGEQKRTVVKLDDISKHLINATLAAEDQQFYNHFGFNPKGIIRSVFRNASDDTKVGGSTITQQFVKNSILSPEKTYTRKVKELILALEIEVKFSKDEILQMYLNEIAYGSNAYGAEAAAQTFFGKSAKDLTLNEAATLAALPNAPTYYSPFGAHTDDLEIRKNWILSEMEKNGYITKEQFEEAKTQTAKYKEPEAGIIAAHFVMYVRELLEKKYSEELIKEGGFTVVTTLDMDLQHLAERVIPEGVERNKKYGATNAALVSIDPRNGQILAMQGSKDYFDRENDGNVNVTLAERQPGSSFKPFAYAKAFEKGFTTETILFDVYTDFNNYKPQNYDLSTHGPVTMRQALAGSLNIPAVKTLYLAGVEDTIKLAEDMGFTTFKDRSRFGLSLVLGGGEVKLLEETAAFGVFATNGTKYETTPILKLVDRNGKVLEDNSGGPKGKEVISTKTAKMINSILSDGNARRSVFGNNGNVLNLPDVKAAAKTGTTENFRDAWTVGYTTNLVTGIWVGNNNGAVMHKGADGIYVAAPIWRDFMVEATKNREKKDFEPMEEDHVDKPILRGQVMPEITVKVHKVTGKKATDLTPPELVEERKYRIVHSILYYVDKNNPRGPAPKNPNDDPQFASWEGAVQGWAAKMGYRFESPPSETDDSNTSGSQPTISISSPENGSMVTDSSVLLRASANASHGIKQIEFYFDGGRISSDNSFPYETQVNLSGKSSGFHNLTAKVLDLMGNSADSTVSINYKPDENEEPKKATSISIVSPGSMTVTSANFPLNISAKTTGDLDITKVEFFLDGNVIDRQPGAGNNKTYVTAIQNPGPGAHSIKASAVDENGRGVFSGTITITVK